MRPKHISFLLLLIATVLSGCVSVNVTPETVLSTPKPVTLTVKPIPTDTPVLMVTHLRSPTVISPTFTSTQIPTLTPLSTLDPKQAEETIRTLLKEPVDCPAPCFWGIVPGRTMISEAIDIITHLGLQVEQTNSRENKDIYTIVYEFDNELSITVILTVQDHIIENLRIKLTPEKSQPGVPREWLAYSPETLIDRYGTPSRVDFIASRSPADDLGPYPWYVMTVYFESADLVIEYGGGQISSVGSFRVCPLSDQFNSILIWLGKNPENPPGGGITLGKATSLTLEEFASIMKGDLEDACIELESEAFYE